VAAGQPKTRTLCRVAGFLLSAVQARASMPYHRNCGTPAGCNPFYPFNAMTLFDKLRAIGSPFKSKPKTEPAPQGAPVEAMPSAQAQAQAQRFEQAVALHQNGQLAQAQALYEDIVRTQPNHADAWHFLGLIGFQSNDPQRAVVLIGKAIAINPKNAVYYINHGNALRSLQRLEDALASFDKAIAAKPDFADAYVLRGNTQQELLQLDAAVASYDRALALRPQDLTACFNRGNALKALGQLEAAIASFDQAIAIEPQFADAFVNRGLALHDHKQHEAAAASFAQAIAIRPDFAEAYFNRGLALQVCQPAEAHLDEAIAMFGTACQMLPDGPLTHLTHARALAKAQRFDEAEAAARRALAADPLDGCGAGMFLAGLGVAPMPDRIPDALLHNLYNVRATTWDSGENAHYQGAALVGQALLARRPDELLDVLDAGCGTGMVGSLVRTRARNLVGVDMSQPMLDRAHDKGDYDTLVCGDLVAYLAEHAQAFDAVVSAATLIHFASLRPIFDAAALALRPQGLFIFTAFPNEKDPLGFGVDHLDGMAQGGCYVHGRQYLRDLALDTGFAVEELGEQIHEYEANGKAKICLLVTLSRPPSPSP
jgi:predicted TPR repeat methyltransferase